MKIDCKNGCPSCNDKECLEVTEMTSHSVTLDEKGNLQLSNESPMGFQELYCSNCGELWRLEEVELVGEIEY